MILIGICDIQVLHKHDRHLLYANKFLLRVAVTVQVLSAVTRNNRNRATILL